MGDGERSVNCTSHTEHKAHTTHKCCTFLLQPQIKNSLLFHVIKKTLIYSLLLHYCSFQTVSLSVTQEKQAVS